jgi:hypothetical protein
MVGHPDEIQECAARLNLVLPEPCTQSAARLPLIQTVAKGIGLTHGNER